MPGGFIKTFGMYQGSEQIGFICFAEYMPWKDKTKKRTLHANRLVIHPDYVGLSLGIHLINATSEYLKKDYRVMTKFSSLPVFRALIKSEKWKLVDSKFDTSGGNLDSSTTTRRKKVKWWSFEFTGLQQ